jgi:glycosyltransferase involved in cell wall biosynthesis
MAIVQSALSTRGSRHELISDEMSMEDSTKEYYEKQADSMMISAVIPVFNEQEVIDEFSTRLIESLEHTVPDYEIIFVVEGNDATEEKLSLLAKVNPRVKVHYSPKRLGLGPATKKGLELIDPRTDYVLIMDADLNHHPEEIDRLLKVSSKADIVVGCRSRDHGLVNELPFFKRVVSGSTNWILRKAFGIPCSDVTSGFRLYSAKTIERIRDRLVSKNFEITAELLIRAKKEGYSIAEVPITFTRRPRGVSKLSFIKSGIGYGILLLRLG